MKKIYIYFAFLLSILSFGQKINFEPTIRVTYDSKLQLGEKYQHNQKFVLVGNSQDYYFGAAQNYLNDTGQYEIKGIDTRAISDYFQERLIRSNNKTSVFITIIDSKVRYEEKGGIKWVLYSDTKIINGIKCQMAATNKFGRRWIAYFSKDYPQSLGPYKFNGLPGLIFELYDTRDDYHFTLTKVEKYTDEFDFNLNEYKNYPKDKYLKAKYNMEFTLAGYPADMGEELRRELQNAYDRKKKMYDNPLELKPFE
ncbi:GLPGLI family protein [Chryseobacterium sp. PS-8]|uniref:GLPGLI family protein n=1 Tax=Chryseobacterium indicum TaxID=2766954 RepID=A0ABS9CA46_9FLAO|nr:GLPGLI family protein [Chryseobacterium sp. PS-8]MCF2220850.1 GLPGLI family protein [Chryseobacterium sp. PS-8]